ncbi:MAG: HD domain-containing protein [Actinomycetota bacterium]
MTDRLQQQLDFLMEIDRLKSVNRQTLITDRSRRENTAEHSWHLAMFAFVLAEHANEDVDLLHVLQLCLIHDIVEIDAGDTFAYDTSAYSDKDEREQRAADRLFGLLPADQHARLRALWEEYEAMETAESRFANAVDRMQPAMLNHMVGEMSTWREHGISEPQAVKRLLPIGDGSDRLWQHTREVIAEAVRRGNLTEG